MQSTIKFTFLILFITSCTKSYTPEDLYGEWTQDVDTTRNNTRRKLIFKDDKMIMFDEFILKRNKDELEYYIDSIFHHQSDSFHRKNDFFQFTVKKDTIKYRNYPLKLRQFWDSTTYKIHISNLNDSSLRLDFIFLDKFHSSVSFKKS